MDLQPSVHDAVDDLISRAFASRYADAASAAAWSAQALALAESRGDPRQVVRALRMVGVTAIQLEHDRDAEDALRRALAMLDADDDSHLRGSVLSALATIHARHGDMPAATEAVLAAIALLADAHCELLADARNVYSTILQSVGDYPGALEQLQESDACLRRAAASPLHAAVLSNTGIIHARLGDNARAIATFARALSALESDPHDSRHATLHTNICVSCTAEGSFAEALRHGELALQLARAQGSRSIEALTLTNLADVHLRTGEPDRALAELREAASLCVAADLRTVEVDVRAHLGAALLAAGSIPDALVELHEALRLAEAAGLSGEIYAIHATLSQAYERQGDVASALRHYKRHHEVHAAVWSDRQNQRMRVLLIRAEMEQAERDTQTLRARNEALATANAANAVLLQRVEEQRKVLERLSLEDPLTGVANRRHLDVQLERELARAWRFGSVLTLALIDVDHFKSINDTFSHATGDEVLRAIAGHLLGRTRQVDILARYGGEEFVLVFVETPLDVGFGLCEEIRAGVAALDLSALMPGRSVSVSIGVASSEEADSASRLTALADARLYQAKHSGRNRVAGAGDLVLG